MLVSTFKLHVLKQGKRFGLVLESGDSTPEFDNDLMEILQGTGADYSILLPPGYTFSIETHHLPEAEQNL